MAEALMVQLYGDIPQCVAGLASEPGLIRQHQVLCGIGLDPVIGVNVTHDSCPLVLEHLAAYGMVPVVMAIEEILDGGLGDPPDLLQHCLGVLKLHGVDDHHPVLSHDEQGDDEPRGGEAEHPRGHLLASSFGSLET